MKPQVLFVVGPTGAGKSKVGMELARRLGGEIISADSMQVYRGMDIGTAKPSQADQKKIPHHLLDIRPAGRPFSVFEYRDRALAKIQNILKRKKVPVVVGGSGLYVRALMEGLREDPGPDPWLRKRLSQEAKTTGLAGLYATLCRRDPDRARKVKPRDEKRIIRALEILERSSAGCKPLPAWRDTEGIRPAVQPSLEMLGLQPIVIGITKERSRLYQDIEKRVDQMFRKGLVREVRALLKGRFSKTAAQAIGYKEIREMLCRKQSLGEARDRIKKNTRHFAKRQLTWFRREKGIQWFVWNAGEGVDEMCRRILAGISDFEAHGPR